MMDKSISIDMSAVAALFGLKLGERFYLESLSGVRQSGYWEFDKRGLVNVIPDFGKCYAPGDTEAVFRNLCVGNYKVIKKNNE